MWSLRVNMCATAEAIDFKFGTQLAFGKARHEIIPRGKSGGSLGLVELPKILGAPLIFPQRLKLVT